MTLSGIGYGEIAQVWEEKFADIPNFSLFLATETLTIDIDANRRFSGASMIKTFILEVAAHQVSCGETAWDKSLTVNIQHSSEGDGVLRYWPFPQSLTLLQACGLMIAVSDNTATNAVVDHLGGIENVNDIIDTLGYKQSRLRAWVGGLRQDARRSEWVVDELMCNKAGLSVVTAKEHAKCVSALVTDPVCSSLLCSQNDKRSLARFLAEGAVFAHKTGTVDGLRHDGGRLLLENGDFLDVHVLTDGQARSESVDDSACKAMGLAMRDTMRLMGLGGLTLDI